MSVPVPEKVIDPPQYSFDNVPLPSEDQPVKSEPRSTNSSTTAVPNTYWTEPEAETTGGHGIPDCPDGGVQAWLVVLGGFLTYFATFGK